ncbi:MAG: hypothetical protein ACJ8AO_09955 [Gemmatimonadaceae bacterium]
MRAHPVNRGTHGMAARSRWARSPDGCTLIAVEDPAAVEAEPVPNGFLVAKERAGLVVQQDGVWDVAPSPDWEQVAYSLAYQLQGRERDSIPPNEWADFARRIGLPQDTVRRGAFVSSGMALAYAAARPVVRGLEPGAPPAPLPMIGGWRVGWAPDGALLVSGNPTHAQDHSPPSAWVRVDAATGSVVGAAVPAPARDSVRWIEGPTIDISVPLDSTTERLIALAGGRTIEGRRGFIRLRDPKGGVFDVGPGIPMGATRGGRFIVAVRPRVGGREYDPPTELVVYELLHGR